MKKTILSVFTFIFIIIGCNTPRASVKNVNSNPVAKMSSDISQNENDNTNITDKNVNTARIVIYDAYLSMTVENPEISVADIGKIALKYSGYIQVSSSYSITIRIKSDKLNAAVDEISTFGEVDYKNITGQDVTEEYLDYQIRLENALKSRERYLELLAKAENVEAALKVEKELERLNTVIDVLKGQINRIDNQVEFSTITVNLNEKQKPGLIGYVFKGLYYSVKWLFVRN